ncbi:MAG: transglycosylase domain-containing protein [Candidatus Pacebacteria bacterium]|nr:transglycosylase domain-containing protein [Candidatus Paceibacterota bacterium]
MRHRKKIKNLALLTSSLGIICVGLAILWLSTIKMPDISSFEQRRVTQSTKIYDRTGTILLYDVHEDTKRTVVPFDQISDYVKKGTIAIEDIDFYNHIGIKPTSIIRAVIANLVPGGLTQGGSTITQQVIKNTVLTKDKTITRKLKEWVLSLKLEKMLTKDQILSTYLNETPYGGSLYGVEEASRAFYGKSSKDLTLAEAAYISALSQAPTYYSPYGKNKAALDARKDLVLLKMKENKFITQEEYDAAKKEVVNFLERSSTSIRAPHFALMVKQYLVEKYGEDFVFQNGLKVTTTLDYKLQEKAEGVVKNFASKLNDDYGASNTAMVAIDPRNGDIVIMVGSKNYFDQTIDGNFNIITAHRQPGSTMKPFVYAAAFNKGYTPDTMLFDVKTEFSSECTPDGKPKNPKNDKIKCYSPDNYDDIYPGPMTMRFALAQSRNIPAVKTLYLAGIKESISLSNEMGLESLNDPDRYGLTLVLGGGEVSPLEITSGYGVFANDGIKNNPRFILRVEDNSGKVLEEGRTVPERVLSENTARQISDILSDKKVRIDSLTNLLSGVPREVAIKTGTTNDYRDVWVIGYTPSLVLTAWAGNNDNSPMERKVAGLIIAPVWSALFADIASSLPNDYFKKPEPLPQGLKPVLNGTWKGGESYFKDTVSGKLATEFTPNETKEEVINPSVHSILHWVDKDTPRGPIPKNPENDSQYISWEYGVRKWFADWQKKNPGFTESNSFYIPVEKDDVHTAETQLQVSLDTDLPNRVDDEDTVTINFSVKSEFPYRKSELYINNKYISSTERKSFSFIPKDLDLDGDISITIRSYDSVYNKGEKTFDLKVK